MSDIFVDKLRELETGMITDAMNLIGVSGWMKDLAPVNPEHKICGRAFTMQFTTEGNPDAKAYSIYEVLDLVRPGDVLVLATNDCQNAIIGENVSHSAQRQGAAGIIVDGKIRDTGTVKTMDMPVFSKGSAIQFMPKNFKLTAHSVPVMCGGTAVYPGDYIVGDIDGIIALSKECAEEVILKAEKIAVIEKEMEVAIESGKSMQECLAVISKKKHV